MPQPTITQNIFFGNNALPNGQGTMAWTSLADFASWFPGEYQVDGSNRLIGSQQVPFRGKSYYVSDDWAGKSIIVPSRYYEGPGVSLGAAKAQLSQAGEQYLSFDNKVTATLVKLRSFGTPKMLRRNAPMWWDLPALEFYAKESFFADVATTTPAGFPISQGGAVAPGTLVTTAIAYAGSVRTFPVFTLNVPVGNGVVINQFAIKNNMTGDTLVITFGPPLAAATAWTITIDTEALTVVDQNGLFHDAVGTWPPLFGPAGQSQNLATTLICASGTTTNVTVGCTFKNKWEL